MLVPQSASWPYRGTEDSSSLRREMARLFEDFVPGVDEKDVELSAANGVMTIMAKKKAETEKKDEIDEVRTPNWLANGWWPRRKRR